MKRILFLFGIAVIILFGLMFARNNAKSSIMQVFNSKMQPQSNVVIDNHMFTLLIASTEAQKELGLGGRTSIPADTAMLFPFPKAEYYTFWMKGMRFPLDMIYIRGDKIVTMFRDVKNPPLGTPDSQLDIYRPLEPADKIIEMNSGSALKYGFKLGDSVKISL